MNDTVQRDQTSELAAMKKLKRRTRYCGRTSCGATGLTQTDQRRALKSVSSLGPGRDVALSVERQCLSLSPPLGCLYSDFFVRCLHVMT